MAENVTVAAAKPRRKPPRPEVDPAVAEEWVGATGLLDFGKLRIRVKVTEVRNRYGNVDCLVVPTDGLGKQWIQSTRIARSKTKK